MPRDVTVTFQDGSSHTYRGVPDDATPDQVEARASGDFGKRVTSLDGGAPAQHGAVEPRRGRPGRVPQPAQAPQEDEYTYDPETGARIPLSTYNARFDGAAAVPEAALNLASGSIAAPVAGVAGLASAPFVGTERAADIVHRTQEALTYQPKTEGGQEVAGAVTYPFEKLAQGADFLGGKTAEATGSPALGAMVNAGAQFAPALLLRRGGGAAEKPAPRPRVEPTIGELPNVTRAREYVASRTGLDWNSLSDSVKARISDIAKDAETLDRLDPKALERQAELESLPVPVPATRGQLTRDPVQLRNEGNASATTTGKPIRDVHVAQNRALIDNLELLKGKVSGRGAARATAETPEQVGLSVQDAGLRTKLRLKQQQVSDLYKQAESTGELQGPVSPRPVLDAIANSPDKTHFGWVRGWLDEIGAVKRESAEGITVESMQNLTLKQLEDLRQAAVARAMDGGTEGYYAGKIIRAVDEATEGAGGQAYQAARKARKEQALEFEDQAAVARLVENKSRTDRAVALEDTWRKTVLGGSIEDLNKVKRSLLTGGDTTTRTAGKKAWNDMRAQTIQHIIDEATKSVTRFEDGTPNMTPAALERAIRQVGPEKLDSLFGPGTVNSLNKIMEATRTVKTEPPPGFKSSPTFANAIAFLEKSLQRVPVLGKAVTETIRGAAARKAATDTPLSTQPRGPLTRPAFEKTTRDQLRDLYLYGGAAAQEGR